MFGISFYLFFSMHVVVNTQDFLTLNFSLGCFITPPLFFFLFSLFSRVDLFTRAIQVITLPPPGIP